MKVTAVLGTVAVCTLMLGEPGDEDAGAASAGGARAALAIAIDRPIDWSFDVKTYNCAGLAFRTYRYMSLPDVESVLARCRELTPRDATCPPGWVKIWVWRYDVHRETEDGLIEASHPDGHLVAGRADASGTGPEMVFSKYGRGPILGPASPETWAPPGRELEGVNRAGRRVYRIRAHMTQSCYCAPPDMLRGSKPVIAALPN